MATPNRYMTPKEVAAFLGMSSRWIYRRIQLGGGPPFRRRGRIILYLRTDVELWDRQQISKPHVKTRLNGTNSISTHLS